MSDRLAQQRLEVGVGLGERPLDVLVQIDRVELDPGRTPRVLVDLPDLQRRMLEDGAREGEEEGVAERLVRGGGNALVADRLRDGVAAGDGRGSVLSCRVQSRLVSLPVKRDKVRYAWLGQIWNAAQTNMCVSLRMIRWWETLLGTDPLSLAVVAAIAAEFQWLQRWNALIGTSHRASRSRNFGTCLN